MPSRNKDTNALRALDAIATRVGSGGGRGGARARSRRNAPNICKEYEKIKPLLKTALALIERIPVYGKKIGAAIRFLMQVADTVCPVI